LKGLGFAADTYSGHSGSTCLLAHCH